VEALKEPEAITCDHRIGCDERVVAIEVSTPTGPPRRLYAIRDTHLDYWRGASPLNAYDAWTRDTKRRAVFQTRAEAERELASILDTRGRTPPWKR